MGTSGSSRSVLLQRSIWHELNWPSGSPHRVTEDDVYRGFFIPAGAIVIQNIWCAINFQRAILTIG